MKTKLFLFLAVAVLLGACTSTVIAQKQKYGNNRDKPENKPDSTHNFTRLSLACNTACHLSISFCFCKQCHLAILYCMAKNHEEHGKHREHTLW